MTVPHVSAGEVARASEQNALIDAVNTHTTTIDDAATALADQDTRISTLEERPSGPAPGLYSGEWTDNNAKGTGGQSIDTNEGEKVTDVYVPIGTPTGCRLENGSLVVDQGGLWMITTSLQYAGGTSVRAAWLSRGTATSGSGLPKMGPIAGPSMDAQSVVAAPRLAAGDAVSIYAAVWQGGAAVRIWRALGNSLSAVWLGP